MGANQDMKALASKGGKARAKAMSKRARRESAIIAAVARWTRVKALKEITT